MEILASGFNLRGKAPEGRKRFPISPIASLASLAAVLAVVAVVGYAAVPETARPRSSGVLPFEGPPATSGPVDPDLIPEARAVLRYLESVWQKKVILGQSENPSPSGDREQVARIRELSGKRPALISLDLSGWDQPIWGERYRYHLQNAITTARHFWEKEGGIVSMQWHWSHPTSEKPSAWVEQSGPLDIGRAITPGTPEHDAVMRDLKNTADYLQQLSDARVPVLFRPLHEIDGGWFWWTDLQRPENTAALWRMMYDYLVKERTLHNLIWVYSVAQGVGMKDPSEVERAAFRRRIYPGDDYVDIVGIDVYAGGQLSYRENGWALFYGYMRAVFPGKMVALTECPAVPNPDRMQREAAQWLYCLPWWPPGQDNPEDWIKFVANHEHMITLDDLPDLRAGKAE